jgi:hypothetical protein
MKFIALIAIALSASSFASTKMGPEAVEMFNVLNHNSVQECLRDADLNLVNTSIKKDVFRCPGCNTYTITGNKRNIDIVLPEQTIVTIKGQGVRGFGNQWVQTYTCDIKTK